MSSSERFVRDVFIRGVVAVFVFRVRGRRSVHVIQSSQFFYRHGKRRHDSYRRRVDVFVQRAFDVFRTNDITDDVVNIVLVRLSRHVFSSVVVVVVSSFGFIGVVVSVFS